MTSERCGVVERCVLFIHDLRDGCILANIRIYSDNSCNNWCGKVGRCAWFKREWRADYVMASNIISCRKHGYSFEVWNYCAWCGTSMRDDMCCIGGYLVRTGMTISLRKLSRVYQIALRIVVVYGTIVQNVVQAE